MSIADNGLATGTIKAEADVTTPEELARDLFGASLDEPGEIYQAQAQVMEIRSPEIEQTIYVVAAWNTFRKCWVVRHGQFSDRRIAERAALNLGSYWAERTIVKIDLPAKEIVYPNNRPAVSVVGHNDPLATPEVENMLPDGQEKLQ